MTGAGRTAALSERIVREMRPSRRPIAALAVVAVAWAVWLTGPGWATPAFVVAALAGAALGVIDVRDQRLPDVILYPALSVCAALLVAAAVVTGAWENLARSGLGAVALGAVYHGLSMVGHRGLGLGDVKLAVLLGLLAGWQGWRAMLWSVVLPFHLGGIVAAGPLIDPPVDAPVRSSHTRGSYRCDDLCAVAAQSTGDIGPPVAVDARFCSNAVTSPSTRPRVYPSGARHSTRQEIWPTGDRWL